MKKIVRYDAEHDEITYTCKECSAEQWECLGKGERVKVLICEQCGFEIGIIDVKRLTETARAANP